MRQWRCCAGIKWSGRERKRDTTGSMKHEAEKKLTIIYIIEEKSVSDYVKSNIERTSIIRLSETIE